MFECYHCGARAVIWDCDFDSEDFGYDRPGIIQTFHCTSCGADIEYAIWIDDEEEADVDPAD